MKWTSEKENKADWKTGQDYQKRNQGSSRIQQNKILCYRQKAAKGGMKLSAYIRQIAINGAVTPRLSEEERHFVRQLIEKRNNINRL